MTVERITIIWSDTMGCYRVSKPSWDGAEVVLANDYDQLESQRDALLRALDSALHPQGNGDYSYASQMYDSITAQIKAQQ